MHGNARCVDYEGPAIVIGWFFPIPSLKNSFESKFMVLSFASNIELDLLHSVKL